MIEKYIKTSKEQALYDFIFANEIDLKNQMTAVSNFDSSVIVSYNKFISKGYTPDEIIINLTCTFRKGQVQSNNTSVHYAYEATVRNNLHIESFSTNGAFQITNIDYSKTQNDKGLELLKIWGL